MIRIGLVGLGGFGKLHLSTLKSIPNCRVEAVCDKRVEIARSLSKENGLKYYTEYNDLLNDGDIDAVDIVVDEQLHYEFAKKALLKGKHVFLEKPMSLRYEEAEEIMRLAKKSGRTLIVGLLLRFDIRHVILKEKVENGEIGDIRHIYCRRNFTQLGFRKYGRVHPFCTAAIHDIDQIIWLSCGEVESVYAQERSFWEEKNPDSVCAILNLKGGTTAIIENVWHLPEQNPFGFEFQLEIIGSKGTIKIGNKSDIEIWSSDNKVIHKELEKALDLPVQYPELFFGSKVRDKVMGALHEELAHFVECAESGKQSEITKLEDACYGIEVANALMESAKTNKIIHLSRRT